MKVFCTFKLIRCIINTIFSLIARYYSPLHIENGIQNFEGRFVLQTSHKYNVANQMRQDKIRRITQHKRAQRKTPFYVYKFLLTRSPGKEELQAFPDNVYLNRFFLSFDAIVYLAF